MKTFIQLNKLEEEILSAEKFLKLSEKELLDISYSEIVPPKIGQRDFGAIKVHYKNPVYMRTK